ncbi:MAG: hypothetical protein QOG53_468 [Frankiales bacterium]|nr:hypothetical protein [Frankiales bacterium]
MDAVVPAQSEGEVFPRSAIAEGLLRNLDMAVIVCDTGLVVREFNPAAERLFGWRRDQVVGMPSVDFPTTAEGDAESRQRVTDILAGDTWTGDLPVTRPDGQTVNYRFRAARLTDERGTPVGIVSMAIEAAEHAAAEQARAIFDALFGDSPVGIGIFTTDLRYVRLNAAMESMSGIRSDDVVGLRLQDVFPDYVPVHEMLTTVATTGEPVLGMEVTGTTPATGEIENSWLLSAYRTATLDGDHQVVFVSLDVTERRRAESMAADASRRLQLLAEVGALFSRDLDLDERLDALSDLLVPSVADHLIIDVFDDDGGLRRAMARHPAEVVNAASYQAFAPHQLVEYGPSHPAGIALAEGHTVHIADVSDDIVAHALLDARAVAQAQRLGMRSAVSVPMAVRGEVFGVLTALTSVSGRAYTEADASFIEDVAARAAAALENSRRFAREREVAVHLQRSLLPSVLPDLPGLEIAWSYEPGAMGLTVGGDWVDAFPLPGGRIGLAVGDVMGRGLVAAGVMGQIRSSLRAYAALDWTPSGVLTAVDTLVAASGEGSPDVRIATCIYAVLDPTTDELELACAGHVPPLVIDPAGFRTLELPTGPPLGLGAGGYTEALAALPAGTMLGLCSDGLVESRDTELPDGLAALGRLLSGGGLPLSELCAAAMQLAPGGGADNDDAVLLLARVTTPMPRFIESVPFTHRAAEHARHRLAAALESWDAADLVERAELCASEVMTNAFEHGRGPLELRARLAADALHVEVHDRGRRPPQPRDALPDDESGRGLAILDATADRWGSRQRSIGKAVWFTLRRVTDGGRGHAASYG